MRRPGLFVVVVAVQDNWLTVHLIGAVENRLSEISINYETI